VHEIPGEEPMVLDLKEKGTRELETWLARYILRF
jgi:hypothetical protein